MQTYLVAQGPLHIPAIPAAKRTGYDDTSLLRQPWSYETPFDYNPGYPPGYPYSIERDRKVFYPSYPDQYAQVSCTACDRWTTSILISSFDHSPTALLESRTAVSRGGKATHHTPTNGDHIERPKFLRKYLHQQLKIVHERCCWLSINR